MNAGSNGIGNIIILFGCSGNNWAGDGSCVPTTYPTTAEPACNGHVGTDGACPTAGDPVLIPSGAKFEAVTDYTSGGPNPIEIKRYYRSLLMPTSGDDDGMGLGWRTDVVGRQLEMYASEYDAIIRREDGERARFLNSNSSALTTPGPWNPYTVQIINYIQPNTVFAERDAKDKFSQITANSVYQYTDENDTVDTFNNVGGTYLVTQTTWRGGYHRNYSYDGNNHLTGITDSFGRSIALTWTGNVITSINLPDGTKLQYTYQQQVVSGLSIPGTEVLTQVARYKSDGTLIDTTGYQYDRSSTTTPLLTGVVDAKGVQIETTTYNQLGQALTAQRAGGADATSFAYDDSSSPLQRTVTNALGQATTYSVTATQTLPSALYVSSISRQASGTVPAATLQQNYDANGFLSERIDWNGVDYKYTNDTTGRETQRIEDYNGVARTINTTWSATFRLPTEIASPNLTVDYTYDTNGRLTQRTETDTSVHNGKSRTWNYTWTASGLLTSVTGPRTDLTQTTSYTYDSNGNLATVKDALNHVTTVTSVDARGLPLSVMDVNGVVTNIAYDALGRVTSSSVQGPTPATTSFTYDVNGLLTSVTAPNGSVLNYTYDSAYRLTGISDSLGNSMSFTLDGLGDRTQSQILTGTAQVLKTNSATFDTLGRLLSSIGASNQTTSYQYDNNGNLTNLIDPRTAATQKAFDGLNRIKQITDALNGVTTLVHDGQDNLTSLTDPKTHVTTYTVNGFGFVTQVISPDSGTTTLTYDLAGNVTSRSDGRKIVTNYTYDALNRLLTRTYPSDTTENVAFTYDSTASGNYGIGRMTSVTDGVGSASFVYDAYGNRIAESRTIAGIQYTTRYAYDLAGNVTQITYPSGLIVNYQRDTLGRVSGMTTQTNSLATPVTVASNVQYLPFGSMTAMAFGNGTQLTNTYDQDYRLTGIQAATPTAQSLSLSYDGANNITAITDAVNSNLSQTFQYDLVGRVTNGVGSYGNDTYTYDALGNRLTRSLVNGGTTSTSYAYTTSNNQLASTTSGSTTLSYTYDANGARTAIKNGRTTLTAYTYNADGRLATAATASLKYDAFGQRSVETITGGGTHFIFGANGLLLAEHSPTGTLVRNYIYLNGQPFALADASGNISYILNDQVGQPQKMLSGTGAVTWQRVAGIFGDTVSQPLGSTSANPQRFPGQQYDAIVGVNYNYFRDYDPAVGRYLESDPLGVAASLNVYVYAGGNPIVFIDQFGLCWVYSQSSGQLRHVDDQGNVDYTANGGYSGYGSGLNNPAMQNVQSHQFGDPAGPIPQGTYSVGKLRYSTNTGPGTMNLTPQPGTNTFGRSLFRMHGDNSDHNHTASTGCIIEGPNVRNKVANSDDKCLQVTP